jgi:hypothetical protein
MTQLGPIRLLPERKQPRHRWRLRPGLRRRAGSVASAAAPVVGRRHSGSTWSVIRVKRCECSVIAISEIPRAAAVAQYDSNCPMDGVGVPAW